jgi:hypothetical protein
MPRKIKREQNEGSPFPAYGYISIILILLMWYLNWTLKGPRTHYLFFPLWLGYSLFVDALVRKRKGNSLLSRSWKKYVLLFVFSIPVWWIFEFINLRSQNWLYLGRDHFTDLEYFLFASLSFSTVIPAVFGTAELVSTFAWIKDEVRGPRIPSHRKGLRILFIIGLSTLLLLLWQPRYFYLFVWISVFFLLDVFNEWNGNRSLVGYSDKKNWRPMISLALGCLVCGFFWEMWNFYAYPKWVYDTPGVEFLYIFEMPLLGYLGYIPFSFELFAFFHLITWTSKQDERSYYIQL